MLVPLCGQSQPSSPHLSSGLTDMDWPFLPHAGLCSQYTAAGVLSVRAARTRHHPGTDWAGINSDRLIENATQRCGVTRPSPRLVSAGTGWPMTDA